MKTKIYELLLSTKQLLFAVALSVFSGTAYSQTFNYTGGIQTVNLGPGTYGVEMWGANGGNSGNTRAGLGGYSSGTLTLPSSTILYVVVGGTPIYTGVSGLQPGGYNGGGSGYANASGRAGAGATHIATATGVLSALVSNQSAVRMVAGGGGGDQNSGLIGHGGGLSGGGTYPGTQTSSSGGIFGAFGQGGDVTISYGGGGGGGWYGGGGNQNNAGSGGSGYIGGVTNGVTIMSGQPGFVTNPEISGNGRVIITTLCNITTINASTTGPGPICIGNSATLTTNAISNYVWSNGGSTASVVVSPTVTTQYTLTATSPLNCTASSVITVTVNPITPTVTAVSSNSSVCAGKPITLTATGLNTYTWTSGSANGASFIPSSNSGYTVTGTNACGNYSAAVAEVTINPIPNVTASVNNPTVCNGSNIILTGGGNATSYTWSGGVLNNVAFAPGASASYTVTGGSANGCTATAVVSNTVLITPNVPPTASPTVICLGQTATLTATGATGYTWTPGTALNSFTAAVSPPMATTYTLVRTNGACSSTMTINLGVNPLPNVSATASPTQICVGDPVTLNVIGGITYTWMPGGFNASNFQLYPNSTTNYTVTASTGSCLASTVVQLSVNPSPVVGINSSTTQVCAGGSVVLTATGNALNYTWLPGPIVGNNITVNPMVPAIYTLTGTNAFNCSVQQTQLIIANELPVLNLLSSVPFVCAGDPAVLSIQNATMSNVTYSWSSNPGTGSLTTVSPTVTTDYFAFGSNSVTGCTNTNTLTLSVFISTFAVSSPTAICKGNTATLTASGGATGYSWTNVPGAGNTTSVVVTPASTTNYIVVGTTGNCATTLTVPIIVNALPNVSAVALAPRICRLEFGTLTASGATSYLWNTGETTNSITYNTLTVTTIFTLTGTDANGCVKEATVTQFVSTCIGIEALNANNSIGLNVYPNPSNGHFTISSDADIKISIVNALGQVVHTTELTEGNKKDLTVSNLPNGIYFITGESNGVKVNKKIVIEK